MLLLDTHALIWLATDLSELPEAAKSAIRDNAASLYVSSISALEVSLLTQCGKLDWGRNSRARYERALEHHHVTEVPVLGNIAWNSGRLPALHRDPFDRIIIATALEHRMTIVTKDQTIPTYPRVKVVWE